MTAVEDFRRAARECLAKATAATDPDEAQKWIDAADQAQRSAEHVQNQQTQRIMAMARR